MKFYIAAHNLHNLSIEEHFVIKTNVEKLIKISVMGEIVSPTIRDVYKVSATGKPLVLPGVGGITYNLRVGDPAYGWEADHAEPGVSTENKENDARTGQAANTAFNVLSCVGNQAIVATGDAKGDRGIVTGKHGGVEHVLVDFSPEVLREASHRRQNPHKSLRRRLETPRLPRH